MQEPSAEIYPLFKKKLDHALAWTFRKQTRIQRTLRLLETYPPIDQAAILQAAFKDDSWTGELVRRAQNSLPWTDNTLSQK